MNKLTFPKSKIPDDFKQSLNSQTENMTEKQRIKFEERRLIYADRPQRSRIFKNDFLEKLTYVRPWHIFTFWIPVITYWIYNNLSHYDHSALTITMVSFSGILVWTLAEYLIHKYPFHYKSNSVFGRRNVYIMHGNHHDDPFDPLRGVMPITGAVIYVCILYQLFNLVVPAQYMQLFFGCFMIGYLLYDGIHYYTHHGKPKFWLGKYLRKIHLIHHVHDDKMFGISSPLWDFVFGTYTIKGYTPPKEF